MHSNALLSLFALLSLTAAKPTSIHFNSRVDATTPEPLAPSSSGAPPNSGGGSGTACSAAVSALAEGISSNIADQKNEIATVSALGNVLAQSPMDMTLYAATQTSLLGFVTKGIAIRENNQKIAPQGSPALPGLAVVAMAQMTELNLTMSLAVPSTGIVDQARANMTVEMLKGDFEGGIKKNMENLMMATGNCTVAPMPGTGSSTGAEGGKPGGEGSMSAEPAKMEGMAGMAGMGILRSRA